MAATTQAPRLSVLAFAHGTGGGSVLALNSGSRRRLVVDLLLGDTVHRYRFRAAGHSLTALVVPADTGE